MSKGFETKGASRYFDIDLPISVAVDLSRLVRSGIPVSCVRRIEHHKDGSATAFCFSYINQAWYQVHLS
jgi:hypothetical protein